jgi:hypothetical protein
MKVSTADALIRTYFPERTAGRWPRRMSSYTYCSVNSRISATLGTVSSRSGSGVGSPYTARAIKAV